ncbi:MAG: ABC transporter permease [Holosporales bacterium]|jgi:ABC-2 type transport system permease protein|nr:ABC transporter permease [Holosporales bacterium]
MIFAGVKSLILKELQDLLREPKTAFMIFFPILLFLTVFAFASTKDVSNASLVILNEDSGRHSKDILDSIVCTKTFKDTYYVYSYKELNKCINTEKAFIGIVFNKDFSKNVMSEREANIQIITDGRRTNAAMITMGYISQIINKFQTSKMTPNISIRTWYNPNKEALWFSITNIMCMLVVSQVISIVGLSIAREKEAGTFDQLLVTPIKPLGMLIGKITPGIVISICMSTFAMFFAHIFYGIPIRGSILLIIFSMLIFVSAVAGIGVFIAAFANTQQQASLGMFVSMMPIMALSGLMSPVESVTNPLVKTFIKCNPLVYANRLVKGIMLKNMSIYDAFLNIYPLMLIAVVLLLVSGYVFAKTRRLKIF